MAEVQQNLDIGDQNNTPCELDSLQFTLILSYFYVSEETQKNALKYLSYVYLRMVWIWMMGFSMFSAKSLKHQLRDLFFLPEVYCPTALELEPTRVFPRIRGKPPKWMVYYGKPY